MENMSLGSTNNSKFRTGCGVGLVLWLFCENIMADQLAQPKVDPTQLAVADLLQWFTGLLVVLAAIFGCAWLLRKLTGLSPSVAGVLRVIGGISVGGREKVILVQVGGRQLLLGVAPGSVQTLLVLPEGDLIAATDQQADPKRKSSFKQCLQSLNQNRNHDNNE